MSPLCRVFVPCIALACAPAVLLAQDTESPLAALQARESLTDEDTATLRTWIGQRVTGVVGDDAAVAQQEFTRLRSEYKGTDAFKGAYVAVCVETLGSAYKKAPVLAAARLVTVLDLLDDVRTLDVLLGALQDDRAAVRAAAAVALRKLRPKIAANADMFGRTVNALREAGKKEPARQVLQLIYQALNYAVIQPAPDLKVAAAAVLDVLDERVKLFGSGKVRAEGADATGLKVAAALRPAMDPGQQNRCTVLLAKTLHYGVTRYTQGAAPLGKVDDQTSGPDEIALRDAIELLIREAERQLTETLKPDPAPNVTQQMQAANRTEMVNEMNKWAAIFNAQLNLDLKMQAQPPDEGDGD